MGSGAYGPSGCRAEPWPYLLPDYLRRKLKLAFDAGVLPDFLISAQALVENIPLMTRDRRRYGTYFPKVRLISPVH